MKLAVVGANGKVGTELCFLLKDEIEVVPIVRNRLGAIFLNHNGFNCKVADITQDNDAKENLHDVDVIVITAYATDPFSGSQTRTSKSINKKLIKNSVRFSKNNSTIIYLSTIRAFSQKIDPNMSFWSFRKYDREKQYLESLLLSECKKWKKRGFPLRIGHVFGDNQIRTQEMKRILSGEKLLVRTSPEKKSNVVHTVTIKDSIICCMKKDVKPQMYSVVNQPQWTWKDVFDYYNDKKIQIIFDESLAQSKNVTSFLWKILKSNKRFFGPILYYLPSKFDLYVQRKLTMKRLHLAISKLQSIDNDYSTEEFYYKPIPGPFLSGLNETKILLKNYSFEIFNATSENNFS